MQRPKFYSKSFQTVVEDALTRLDNFPPLPEDADEESVALYSKVHKFLAKKVSDVVDHLDLIAPYENQEEVSDIDISTLDEQDEGGEDELDGEGDGDVDPPQTADTMATRIAREFLNDLYAKQRVQCSLEQFRSQVIPSAKRIRLHGKRLTLLEEDKLALERLCYRYPESSETDIDNRFKDDTKYFMEYAATCKQAEDISRRQQVQERIRLRDSLLLSLHDNDGARSYINFVLRTIIAIRFAQDYSRWSMDDKKQYQRQMFLKYHQDQIRNIEHQYGGKEKDKLLTKLFKTFKGRHEKVVTARNHIDRLYRIFGTALLLDPFWQLSTGLEVPKRSKPFGKILSLLKEDMEPAIQKLIEVTRFHQAVEDGNADLEEEPEYPEVNDDAYRLREQIYSNTTTNSQFLLRVMKAVGGTDVHDFVQAFIRNPSGA